MSVGDLITWFNGQNKVEIIVYSLLGIGVLILVTSIIGIFISDLRDKKDAQKDD